MQEFIKMSVIAAIVVAIGALMITSSLAPAAFASHHKHGVYIKQYIRQKNGCSEANCQNAAANVIGNSGGVNVENHN